MDIFLFWFSGLPITVVFVEEVPQPRLALAEVADEDAADKGHHGDSDDDHYPNGDAVVLLTLLAQDWQVCLHEPIEADGLTGVVVKYIVSI